MAQVTIIEAVGSQNSRPKLRCAAYCRISTEIGGQKNSYSAQVNHYSTKFENSETEMLIGIYADEGISATSEDKRVEFKRMIADCRKGKIDRIYTKSISRFSRNTRDCLKNIRELKNLGISVFFEKENIDTANITDELMITIMGGLAQEESTSIGQNVAWGIRKKMRDGTMKYANAPYGYKKNHETGDIEINEETAAVVRKIFEMYLGGMGCRSIAEELNQQGVKPPAGQMWRQNRIGEMLSNPTYIGDSIWQKWYSAGVPAKRTKNTGERDMFYVEGDHDPIIDHITFDKVQEIISSRRIPRTSPQERVFSKKIVCGCCGGLYSFHNRKYRSKWECIQRSNYPGSCEGIGLPQSVIENTFTVMCNKLRRTYKDILIPARKSLNEIKLRKLGGDSSLIDIYKQIADLKEQQHVLTVMRRKNFMTEEKYQAQSAALDIRLMKLNGELRRHTKSSDEDGIISQLDILIDCFENMTEDKETFDEELFSMITENMVIVENKKIEFRLIGGMRFAEKIGGE
ncbi:Site-specific DNA recombinase [Ruminococcus sp. YE71]|uniref:recombinase family protein n=1 Tax=unclassified Ruminococcus TaxID=2608920 RepID=UPI000886E682|nr:MULTISPECIES: recombinase family protein [unclassified Ruminococcus]SDA31239.1 Site-specific DNA recombinase [Ruminococcus sp. YE78]SFW51300.1 Site-specific DNA recombinase [Ruminococcus sp. YE71]